MPEPLGALDVVLDQADLDLRERGRADHEARVRGGVLGVGLRLGEVPAPPPRPGAQVRALHEREERAVLAGPVEQAGELARGLDQRAAEQQRERGDVDGGDAGAGVVEQIERAQGELARLGRAAAHRLAVGEAGDEQSLAGGARVVDVRVEAEARLGAQLRRGAVALRGGAARGLEQQPELPLVVGERVDRAGQRRDRLHGAVGQLQRGAELGRDERVALRGGREVLGGGVVVAPTAARPRPARA